MTCPICHTQLNGDVKVCPQCRRQFPLPAGADETILQTRDVVKRYGSGNTEVIAVNNINLQVKQGAIALIMGPSGSGKTSLLLLLGCLMQSTSGSIEFLGTQITQLSPKQLSAFRLFHLGFVFQNFNLLNALTALENVEAPLHLANIKRSVIRERAKTLLAELGLEKRFYHRPADLSGGEKQRVAIARAMALGPNLILADEPTANLDSKSGTIVMESFQRVVKAERCSVIVVSHDPRLQDISDRILWLEDGQLQEANLTAARQVGTNLSQEMLVQG